MKIQTMIRGYGPAHNAGLWFRATPEGEAAMQRILSSLGAGAPAAEARPETATMAQAVPAAQVTPWLAAWLLAALVMAGGLLRLRTRVAKGQATR